MVAFNRAMISVQLAGFWTFLSLGPGSRQDPSGQAMGMVSFVVASVAAAWSIYNGVKWHFAKRDGEGLAWAVIGTLVFLGLTARWLVQVR